jgi:PAS domain-containing protein
VSSEHDRPLPRPQPRPSPAQPVGFCGYCGARPAPAAADEASRVCPECQLGLVLHAAPDLAPQPEDAFLVIDEQLHVRAVSRRAERLLRVSETAAIDRPLGEFLLPADVSGDARGLRAAVLHGMFGDHESGASFRIALRPRDTYGGRYAARVGPCRPGPAALVVLAGLDEPRPQLAA